METAYWISGDMGHEVDEVLRTAREEPVDQEEAALINPTQSSSPPIHTTAGVPPSPEPGTGPNPETPAVGTRTGQERSNLADPGVACHLLAYPTGFVPF